MLSRLVEDQQFVDTLLGQDPAKINTPSGGDYVDVRGPWPVYTSGYSRVELIGAKRDISLIEARAQADGLL